MRAWQRCVAAMLVAGWAAALYAGIALWAASPAYGAMTTAAATSSWPAKVALDTVEVASGQDDRLLCDGEEEGDSPTDGADELSMDESEESEEPDETAPVIELSLEEDLPRCLLREKLYVATDLPIGISIQDSSVDETRTTVCGTLLEELVEGDAEGPDCVSFGTWDRAYSDDGQQVYTGALILHEGSYLVSELVHATDTSGNEAWSAYRYEGADVTELVVDVTAPRLSVTFDDGEGEAPQNRIFSCPRAAKILLVEDGMDLDTLNGGNAPLWVEAALEEHTGTTLAQVGQWEEGDAAGSYICEVLFFEDGAYTLEVGGADLAGNVLLTDDSATEVDAGGCYREPRFVIDTQEPEVSAAYAPGTQTPAELDGVLYHRHAVSLEFSVRDRNFSAAETYVTDSEGALVRPVWKASPAEADGMVTWKAALEYGEKSPRAESGVKEVSIVAVDLAGHSKQYTFDRFVIDRTAPEVVKVSLNKEPVYRGHGVSGDDSLLVYNEADGTAVKLSLEAADVHGVGAMWLDDPEGTYTAHASIARGSKKAVLRVMLKDHAREGAHVRTRFTRSVVLHVLDVAGNERTWTLARRGTVDAERKASPVCVELDGDKGHPQALVCDATPPQISLLGCAANTYYNTPQSLGVLVAEDEYASLKEFEPGRSVATVIRRDTHEGQSAHTWSIRVDALEGSGGEYRFDQPLHADGHYEVYASVTDLANNDSGESAIGEFTVDTTPPTISVSWDNSEYAGDRYFRVARAATVAVTEHNFDPSLMSIQTTGTVGPWQSEGDLHTCRVLFDHDTTPSDPHTLKVAGKDLAGNDAEPFEEPAFILDTQPPTIQVAKRVSVDDPYLVGADSTKLEDQSAFAQGMAPVVTVTDSCALDVADVLATLICLNGKQAVSVPVEGKRSAHDTSVVIEWDNLGLGGVGQGERYDVSADDVYDLTVTAKDRAGNGAQTQHVRFSLNRYGSTFFVDDYAQGSAFGTLGSGQVLTEAPRLVVHEISTSGMPRSEGKDGENATVTKEYAGSTVRLTQTPSARNEGYTVEVAGLAASAGEHEGWYEARYVIAAGNFGAGSPTDQGDGAQGTYRVDVSSHDAAGNRNTTALFWGRDRQGGTGVEERSATVEFTLDELGPSVEDVVLPIGITVGRGFEASFLLVDDITNADYIEVLVDGVEQEVTRQDSGEVIRPGEAIERGGIFTFSIDAAPLFAPRSVKIRVWDYTGLAKRRQVREFSGFCVTTMEAELGVAASILLVLALGVYALMRKKLVP